ncbi:hypothetical protein [Alkalimarinus sediminis]|uniref:Uncharacterized protein n=1 Tax=Alkalimarinus sediminis TaxID=1632866 RepID=A0A9E8KR64_9ALTE|nr:hypothetical protein [Alkalimarinus sediminis]UZW76654.1 hypothetical protein NNL22_08755 [Alkalimarinus sediminis]
MSGNPTNREPQFIDIESSSYDEECFPTCIAWSLPDGQIKNVLVMPDEDWSPQDSPLDEETLQHLYDHGVSGIDIIREMNQDLDGKPVYIDGIDYDTDLLEQLYDTFDEEPTFELTPVTSLLTSKGFEEIMDSKNLIMQENNLNIKHAEHNVLALLILARENGLM